MGTPEAKRFKGVVLVSAPFPLYNRPSIQLGTLKAFLNAHLPDVYVAAHHMYLEVAQHIGYPIYQALSERMWLAETVCAALLFPNHFARVKKLYVRKAKGKKALKGLEFERLVSKVKTVSEAFMRRVRWDDFNLAGFSICLCQMTATLYLIRRIKERFPKLTIVGGGSTFSGLASKQLFSAFPEIDYWINGEGERPLTQLTRYLIDNPSDHGFPKISGVIHRHNAQNGAFNRFFQLTDLDTLPLPDYDDYFKRLKSFIPEKRFFPTLPVEFSRGCWWHRKSETGNDDGCVFCNLNLQWEGYRSKRPERAVAEIDNLTSRYEVLDVALMDNLIPARRSGAVFERLSKKTKDFKLFCEIRPNTSRQLLRRMKNAGVGEVQVGIEALSTPLLKKLNKGVTAIQNLEIMKHCEALGIVNDSNLILCFPGSEEKDVTETLRVLDYSLSYRPLRAVNFWLGQGSPMIKTASTYGIRAVFNHTNYGLLFPPEIARNVPLMVQTYRGDLSLQKRRWQPVKQKLKVWKMTYYKLRKNADGGPILSYQDGRDFMIIRQQQLNGPTLKHRLSGDSRAIYLFCEQHRSLKAILDRFGHVSEKKISSFLKMMIDKRLMFREKNRFLSLAIRVQTRYPIDLKIPFASDLMHDPCPNRQ